MSIRVMTWVWEHSEASGTELLLLLAIADAADDAGRNAWPSVNTLARKTRLAPRTVQRLLAKLAEAGHLVITPSKGGRSSNSYNLVLDATKPDDTGPPTTSKPDEGYPQASKKMHNSPQNDDSQSTGGVKMTPRQNDTGDTAMSPQGCHSYVTAGVTQLCHPTHPVPVLDPSSTTSPSTTDGGGGNPISQPDKAPRTDTADVLERLPAQWPLGARSKQRLAEPIAKALDAGWTIDDLAKHLSTNPEGVKSPYGVLSARLADLPTPPARKRLRMTHSAPWCEACDHPTTRLIEHEDGRVSACPTCHPKSAKVGVPA